MAKKKYYQSKKDRRDESIGMKEYEARKRFEDSGMIREDRNAVANMPQNVIMKDWPQASYGEKSYLDDTIRGIDSQMFDDTSEMRKNKKNEKY